MQNRVLNQRRTELETHKILVKQFGIYFVHQQYPFDDLSSRSVDFYIFSPSGDFMVDCSYIGDSEQVKTRHLVSGRILSKLRQYEDWDNGRLVIVLDTTESELPKNIIYPANIEFVTLDNLANLISVMLSYKVL